MLGRGQPGRSRRGQCPRHGGARTPRLTHGRPSGRGTRRGKRQNRCSARAARGPALLRRFRRRRRPPPRRSSRPRQRPGGGRKSRALGSCLIGLVLVFSATPPVAGRVAPLQPPSPPLRFSGCGTGWKEQMETLSMRLSRPAPPPPLSCAAVRTEHAQLGCRPRRSPRPYPLISRVPAGVDVLYNRSFGLLPLILLDEGRKEREERGFSLPLHVVQPRELIFISNAAYVTQLLLRTCLAHPFSPCSNPEREMLQLVDHEIMEGCSKLSHPWGLNRG